MEKTAVLELGEWTRGTLVTQGAQGTRRGCYSRQESGVQRSSGTESPSLHVRGGVTGLAGTALLRTGAWARPCQVPSSSCPSVLRGPAPPLACHPVSAFPDESKEECLPQPRWNYRKGRHCWALGWPGGERLLRCGTGRKTGLKAVRQLLESQPVGGRLQ